MMDDVEEDAFGRSLSRAMKSTISSNALGDDFAVKFLNGVCSAKRRRKRGRRLTTAVVLAALAGVSFAAVRSVVCKTQSQLSERNEKMNYSIGEQGFSNTAVLAAAALSAMTVGAAPEGIETKIDSPNGYHVETQAAAVGDDMWLLSAETPTLVSLAGTGIRGRKVVWTDGVVSFHGNPVKVLGREGLALSASVETHTNRLGSAVRFRRSAFSRRIPISFASSGVDLENAFPVFVRLSESAPSGFRYADSPRNSICFADANDNVLPFEVDTWDETGVSSFWVGVGSLCEDSVIYFYYGADPSEVPVLEPSDVWKNAAYHTVLHMNEGLAELPDSAGGGLRAAITNVSPVVTVVDGPTGHAVSHANAYQMEGFHSETGVSADLFSVSVWYHYPNRIWWEGGAYPLRHGVFNSGSWYLQYEKDNSTKMDFVYAPEGWSPYKTTVATKSIKTDWNFVQMVYDNGAVKVYVNDLESPYFDISKTLPPALTRPLKIGEGNEKAAASTDETRIRTVASSIAWSRAEYLTVSDPLFAVLGGPERCAKGLVICFR